MHGRRQPIERVLGENLQLHSMAEELPDTARPTPHGVDGSL